ncbi:MAG: hypothetical protein QOH95_2185 [Gaiellaceae bacterium]|nr:hypothetical protein [Gaiellaceae bacterium]
MWQALRAELEPLGVEIVTVALDVDPESARPFVERAEPEHPSLIDRAHVVDELFGIVNVPNSVWIDEQGVIVRPVEVSNVRESAIASGKVDPASLPAKLRELITGIHYDHESYVAALRDWAAKGAESTWALEPHEVIARSTPRSPETARAAAHFELGEHLHRLGPVEAAQRHWREAHRLAPENWTYKRQAWQLVDPGAPGPTDVYDGSWIEDVAASGAENYYPPLRP